MSHYCLCAGKELNRFLSIVKKENSLYYESNTRSWFRSFANLPLRPYQERKEGTREVEHSQFGVLDCAMSNSLACPPLPQTGVSALFLKNHTLSHRFRDA